MTTDDDGTTHVTYHGTRVVSVNDTTITLRTGGGRTATTKLRMNQASNQFGLGYRVFQKDYEWYVNFRKDGRPFGPDWLLVGSTMTIDRETLEPVSDE